MQNNFSIVIPTYNRMKEVQRAVRSVVYQDYPSYLREIIVVDDGSTDETVRILELLKTEYISLRTVSFEKNQGRLSARNAGMRTATNNYIVWLDSDDEIISTYLSVLNDAINKFPDYKIFNLGAIIYDEPNLRSYTREVFKPDIRPHNVGHVPFKSGQIGAGSFVFRRELLEEVGYFPETIHPYGGDDSFPALATKQWPELKELYGQNSEGQWLPFGNPYGEDWLLFYLLTRNHLSKPLDIHLYIQHKRN